MSTEVGQAAEDFSARYLEKIGFTILERNWRTRWCEIDIVARRNNIIHFVEVKYRKSGAQGAGLEYITPTKARQLRYAAVHWIAEQTWEGDYQIDAIGITGELTLENIELILNAVEG